MPTITCSKKDFEKLLGTKLTTEKLQELLDYAKAELEKEEGDDIFIKYNDTNQPYLWCPEGLALLLRGIVGKEKGIPKLSLAKSDAVVVVDSSVKSVRPFITGFLAHGPPLSEYVLKLFIQLQEKLCEAYGRRREKVAIGLYPSQKISFPVTYKAVKPEQVAFVPLGFVHKKNLAQILAEHPKGKEYCKLLMHAAQYPLLIDSAQNVLSFPPIINSEHVGKLDVGCTHLFFEATGTDLAAVDLCTTIFAYALSLRGYTIQEITIKGSTKRVTPVLVHEQKVLSPKLVEQRLGLQLSDQEIKKHLLRFRYDCVGNKVVIPPYRKDIMHVYDIIEDIGIAYGYQSITPLFIHTHTRGAVLSNTSFVNGVRDLCVGLGFQEVFSPILTNPSLIHAAMRVEKQECIEIDNYTSVTYSCIRSWILPILLSVLAQNRHAEAPYNIFEEGLVTVRSGNTHQDERHVSIVSSHASVSFTQARQVVEYILRQLGFSFSVYAKDHPTFISGRCACVRVNDKEVAFFGEIHPAVLENVNHNLPAVGIEMNISLLFLEFTPSGRSHEK